MMLVKGNTTIPIGDLFITLAVWLFPIVLFSVYLLYKRTVKKEKLKAKHFIWAFAIELIWWAAIFIVNLLSFNMSLLG